MSKLASNLVELRQKKSLSQSQLAEKLCVTPQCVSRWELGKTEPDIDTLEKMSILFECSIDDLVGKTTAPLKTYSDIRKNFNIIYLVMSIIMILFGIYMVFDLIFIKSSLSYVLFFALSFIYLVFILVSEIIQEIDGNRRKKKINKNVSK